MRVSFTFLAVCGSLLAIFQECSGREGTEACNTTDTSGIYGRNCTGCPDVCVEPVFTCKPLETEPSTQRCQCENDDSPECEKYLFDRTLQHGARDLTVEIEIKSTWILLSLLCWKPSSSLDSEKCINTSSSIKLTELDPATPYDFVVDFYNKLTEKMFNRTWREYTLPAKPQDMNLEDAGDGTLEIRWVQQGRVDNTQCYLVASADGSLRPPQRKKRAFCEWSSLEPFLHFNKVQITVESGGQKANITFDLDYAFVPEVVQSVDVTDVSATSVNVTVVERTAGIGNVSVDRVDVYYAVNRSDGECVVFQRRKTTLCQRPTELAACGDGKVIIDPPVTSPHSSTTTSTPPTSAATTASPQTSTTTKALPVSGGDTKNSKVRHSAMAEPGAKSELLLEVGDLETATRYTLKLTPWFVDCGASDSRAFRGKTKSLSEVTTLFQVTNVTAGPVGSQLRVEWETSRAPSDVSYTVYVTDTVHVISINKSCSVSSRERVLCDCSTNTKCESGWCSCLGVTPAAFWEYSLAVAAKTPRQMTTYSSPVEVISPPTAPGTVSSLKVTMWKDGQTGSQACPGLVNASVVCVTWQDMCPRKRNSFILAYEYTLRGNQGDTTRGTKESYFAKYATSTSPNASHEYRRDSTQKQYQVLLHVDPGVTYKLSVRAGNETGTWGEAATETFTTLAVPEVPDTESMKELVPETDVIAGLHTLQFTVKSTKFLFEKGVKGRGLIVTAGNRQPLSLEALKEYKTYESWCDREKALESGGYMVNEKTLEEETNSPVRVKIGDDSDCLKPCSPYCDGPLHSDTSYSVWVYLCNEAYCTSVALIQNQKTQAAGEHKHDTGDDGAVLGAILIVSGLLLIVCSLVLVIYCVMCRDRSGSGRITSENELSEWNDGLHMVNNRRTRPMTLASLENAIKRKQRDDSLLLRGEFEDLRWMTPKYPHHAGCLDINLCKNRYVNIMAYDHSRVKLSLDHEGSDFINANYVPGYTRDDEYIAAQGPLPFTISDFWRMIWEHRIPIIVMLTLPKENGKIKCEQYWQLQRGDVVKYDNIIVKTASVSNINDYNITIFSLENTQEEGEEREVVHFHYLKWLDMTADLSPESLVEFLTVVRQHITPDRPEPTLVHCSAGVGRTGTFICIDYLMHFINEHHIEDELDIFAFILHMRDFRCNMVQTEDQYIFIHQCARYLMAARRRKETEMLDNGASRAHASTGSCLFDMANNDGSGEIRSINDDLMALALEPADMDTVELDTSEATAPDEECRSRQLKDVAANGDAPLATSSTENLCVP